MYSQDQPPAWLLVDDQLRAASIRRNLVMGTKPECLVEPDHSDVSPFKPCAPRKVMNIVTPPAVTLLRDVRVDKRDNDVVEGLRDKIARLSLSAIWEMI